jgi:hypothetical protein
MKLFISYRSTNSDRVDSIITRLRSLKDAPYSVWQDKDSIPAGKDWWEAIVEAIIDCEAFLFMVSRESVQNPNCRAELSYARKRNRFIVPIVLEGEFTYNPVTGKNDIDYWGQVPDELLAWRAQFLFYVGASFFQGLETALDQKRREPPESLRWRDMPAKKPPDPRLTAGANSDGAALYAEACDYAFRWELGTAERLFQRLVTADDPDFGQDSYDWILILRDYDQIVRLDASESTRYKIPARWTTYAQQFPKPFVRLFDPKGFQARYASASFVVTPPAIVKPRSQDILPSPFAWMHIPPGQVTLKPGGYLSEATTFDVPAFEIAKYPVTNAQFEKFVKAKGYAQQQWWTAGGWHLREKEAWQEPRYWQESTLKQLDHPVVGVSWYEAVAFCLWLSDSTGENISLILHSGPGR